MPVSYKISLDQFTQAKRIVKKGLNILNYNIHR